MQTLTQHADQVVPLFEQAFSQKTSVQWLEIFRELDIVFGRVSHFADVFEDEQALQNQYIKEFQFENGNSCMMMTTPVRLGSQGVLDIGKPVKFAQHSREILQQLGYSKAHIQALQQSGVVHGA